MFLNMTITSVCSSTIVGLPKVKRDKFSVFNFLSFPGQEVSEPDNSAGDQAKETPTESHDDTGLKKIFVSCINR